MIFESERSLSLSLSRYISASPIQEATWEESGATKEEISICWQIVYFIIYETNDLPRNSNTIVFLDDFRIVYILFTL